MLFTACRYAHQDTHDESSKSFSDEATCLWKLILCLSSTWFGPVSADSSLSLPSSAHLGSLMTRARPCKCQQTSAGSVCLNVYSVLHTLSEHQCRRHRTNVNTKALVHVHSPCCASDIGSHTTAVMLGLCYSWQAVGSHRSAQWPSILSVCYLAWQQCRTCLHGQTCTPSANADLNNQIGFASVCRSGLIDAETPQVRNMQLLGSQTCTTWTVSTAKQHCQHASFKWTVRPTEVIQIIPCQLALHDITLMTPASPRVSAHSYYDTWSYSPRL